MICFYLFRWVRDNILIEKRIGLVFVYQFDRVLHKERKFSR